MCMWENRITGFLPKRESRVGRCGVGKKGMLVGNQAQSASALVTARNILTLSSSAGASTASNSPSAEKSIVSRLGEKWAWN